MCLFVAKSCVLAEGELAGAALFAFEAAADFQESIEHLGTLGAACRELRVCLFMHVLEPVEFVGDVECGEDRYFQRVDRECAGRDLSHAAVDEFRQLNNVLSVTIRPNVVGLVVDFNPNGGTTATAFHTAFIDHATDAGTHLSSSAISGSRAATASSMASTFIRMVSRSASSFST